MAINLFGGKTYTLQASISSTATSITLTSFKSPITDEAITMALMNTTIGYGTIAPKTNQSEFITFTGITQNSDGSAILTGVTRGIKRGYNYGSSSDFMLAHQGGAKFILSDQPAALNAMLAGQASAALVIGATSLTGGTTKRLLYDDAGVLAEDSALKWDKTTNQLQVGTGTAIVANNAQFGQTWTDTINDYYDVVVQNLSSGDSATSDYVVSANNDNPSLLGHYGDFGITGSGYTPAAVGSVSSVTVSAAGSSYTAGDILLLVGGDSNAYVNVLTVNGSGAVTSISINDNGTGYSVAASLATTGGTGTGCTINVVSLLDFTAWSANDVTLFASGGNLVISTDGNVVGKTIKFTVGGIATSNLVAELKTTGLVLTSGVSLTPSANDGVPLGTTSLSFSDLFLASGGVINWNAGNTTLTQSANLLTTNAGVYSTNSTKGIGYTTGAGGAVTQATSKSTGVTLDKVCGTITMNNASLAAATSVTFVLTNSTIAANDTVVCSIKSGASNASYIVIVEATAAGSCNICLRNYTIGALGDAVVLNFAVIKSVAA